MLTSALFVLLGLAAAVSAAPTTAHNAISAQDILKIAPSTASCDGALKPEQCRTADVAAPNIAQSFEEYNIHNFNVQATLLSLMLYESTNFTFSANQVPGVPGQGTRNMQSPTYNLQYANYLAARHVCGLTPEKVAAAEGDPVAVLALVNDDHLGFASAAWFLRNKCDPSYEKGLKTGKLAAFNRYLTECVQTTSDARRVAGWKAALALKHWSGKPSGT